MIRGGQLAIGAMLAVPVFFATLRPSTVLQIRAPHFAPVENYNPIDDIRRWRDRRYFLDHGDKFVGSRSPGETATIRAGIDLDTADEPARGRRIAAVMMAYLTLSVAAIAWAALRRRRNTA